MTQKKDKRKYADRREYLIKAVCRRRKELRLKAIAYKGGKCQICSYNKCTEALELHHLNGSKKEFGISCKGITRSWKKIKSELDKCILVCANCHREIHTKQQLLMETSG
ncbi:MAG TPA: hypothetical protein EYP89_03435 [Candidatus Omnitrophica bacterium]|nr:hypothetical protein [Candidatus Omnitrophota bacterium]